MWARFCFLISEAMQMERERRNVGGDHCYDHHHHHHHHHHPDRGLLMESASPSSMYYSHSSSLMQSPPHSSSSHFPVSSSSPGVGGSSVGGNGLGYIEHTVSRFDTLAGVAIKYGVEVADVKRMNGLTTDLQMFALKSLQIPLPGRHPPSPVVSNGYDSPGSTSFDATQTARRHSDLFDSIKSLRLSSSSPRNVSPAMSSLRGYYGLKQNDQNGIGEGFEMAVYHKGGADCLENGTLPKPSQPLGLHRKSKSLANGLSEKGDLVDTLGNRKDVGSDKSFEKLVRRRKSEVDLKHHTPELLLKPDNSNSSGAFSAAAGKGLALRQKAVSRTTSDAEGGGTPQNGLPLGLDSLFSETLLSGVRKSSSTPSFQDSDSNNNNNSTASSSIWPASMLNLTADIQEAITRPIFDGLPKPITGRKNKTALD